VDYLEILRDITPSACKVYAALLYLGRTGKPVEVAYSELMGLTNQSFPTVLDCVKELIARGLVGQDPEKRYLVPTGIIKFNKLSENSCKNNFYNPVGVTNLHPRIMKRMKGKRGGGSGGRGDFKEDTVNGITFEERRAVTIQAASILGAPRGDLKYTSVAQAKLYRILKGGFTTADALEVVRYCRAEYDRGDRFKKLINLIYVWSATQFTALLTAARTTPAHGKAYSTIDDPEARRKWSEDYQRRVRERGLA
jgi:hypothetical protein